MFDGDVRNSHEMRYALASGFVKDGMTVLDVGCGEGLLKEWIPSAKWIGVDKKEICSNKVVDLNTWEADIDYDIFVGLEVMEHLKDTSKFIANAHKAKEYIIVSVPLVPTMFHNKYHLQDYTADKVLSLFKDDEWEEFGMFTQKGIYGLFVWKRK